MKKKRLIRRYCKGGCGRLTKPGNKYILGHTWENRKCTEKARKKMALSKIGNTNASGPKSEEHKKNISIASKGKKQSAEHNLNISLGQIKYNPNDAYCDIWRDREYRKDLLKDYCENANCKGHYKRLCNHHIYLDKKRCAPKDVMTLCNPCHVWLHHKLRSGYNKPANPKDYIIINRPDHVSYIHKPTRKIIRIIKKEKSYVKKTKVINIKTNKEPYTYIGRGTFCGNPFFIGRDGTREEVIEKYRKRFKKMLKSLAFKAKIKRLKGRTLGCHCKPKACHGDIIVNYLEGERE